MRNTSMSSSDSTLGHFMIASKILSCGKCCPSSTLGKVALLVEEGDGEDAEECGDGARAGSGADK